MAFRYKKYLDRASTLLSTEDPMDQSIRAIHEKVKQASVFVQALKQEIGRVIVGQDYLIERMMIGLLADGHVLLGRGSGACQNPGRRTLSTSSGHAFSADSVYAGSSARPI